MKRIKLFELYGKNLITRNSLKIALSKIDKIKDTELEIDFDKIQFISRSCADEYLNFKSDSMKKVVEKNLSKEIKSMLNSVKKQQQDTLQRKIAPVRSGQVIII